METASLSSLLSLPIELLTRITDFLDNEILFMVRLTCKTLDNITIPRFAEENFSHVYCCMPTIKSWQRLREIIGTSSRFRPRVRQITFTANKLEDKSIDDLHIVQKEEQDDVDARKESMMALCQSQPSMLRDDSLVRQTLLDIQGLQQDVSIKFDFTGMFAFLPEEFYEDMLSSIAATRTSVQELVVFGGVFSSLQKTTVYSMTDLAASMSTLRSFAYKGRSYSDWQYEARQRKDYAVLNRILRSASELKHLRVYLHEQVLNPGWTTKDIKYIHMVSDLKEGLAFSDSLAHLISLDFRHATVSKEKLLEVLRRCGSTLSHLTFDNVMLRSGPSSPSSDSYYDTDQGWIEVLRSMKQVPNLEQVVLKLRTVWAAQADDRAKDANMWEDVELEGRENVECGLQVIADGGLYTFPLLD